MAGGEIFIVGAGGHGKVVIDTVERQGALRIAFVLDDAPGLRGGTICGYRVLGAVAELSRLPARNLPSGGLVAIGRNETRVMVGQGLLARGIPLVTAIHPRACLGRDVVIGEGSVVFAGAIVNPAAVIGRHVIVNSGAIVEHDCVVGEGCHLAPGSVLCGTVTVGANTLIGVGAIVSPNLTIGRNVVVGAGATVVRDVPDNVTVVGTPAKIMERNGSA